MAARRPRLTRRGAAALATLALGVVGGLGYVVTDSLSPDCTVRTESHEVALDQQDAEQTAQAVAAVVRRDGTRAAASNAVRGQLDVSAQDADAIAAALTGRAEAALFCRHGGAEDAESDALDGSGLTSRAVAVRADLETNFNELPLGGFAPGGVTTGHIPGSAHYDGRAIDIFFRPINASNSRHGWAVAQYLVANAQRLAINTVIFDAKIWTARRAGSGWRDFRVNTDGKSAETRRILEHRDHVHVDVAG